MNKAELVASVAEMSGLTKSDAEKAVNAFTCSVTKALCAGDKVALVGFGTFNAATRAARTGRNPANGKEIKIPARTNGKFTPGKDLKDLKPATCKK